MASTDHRRLRVVKFVGIFDLFLAVTTMAYATFQFSYGESLIPGHMSRREKLTRLVVYSSLHYCFLLIQALMAITLYLSADRVMEEPVLNLQRLKTWRAWSSVFVIVLLVDAFFVGLLMGHNDQGDGRGSRNRKMISLILLITQVLLRPLGICIVKKMERLISRDMGGVFKTQRSIIYDVVP